MAAAAIPLILSAAPQIIDLIAGLVHKKAPAVEQQLGSGTGPVKFASVFEYVVTSLTQAATAGQIDKTLPSDDAIKTIIQSVISSLKLQGALTADVSAPTAANPQTVVLTAGQSLTITVK